MTTRSVRVATWVSLFAVLAPCAQAQAQDPAWYLSYQELPRVFDAAKILSGVRGRLDYFATAFTVIGCAVVMIGAVRKVAKARTGEESLGWVSGMVMTVALMVTGPAIGKAVFSAADELALKSNYSNPQTILTTWQAFRAIMPSGTATLDVLETAEQEVDSQTSSSKQDAAWTKKAWDWMKRAWGAMKTAGSSMIAGLRAAVNNIIIFFILLLPAVVLLLGMVALAFGSFLRELLHQTMDVLLPLMIAMSAFAPMRGACLNYLTKYISVALWPVAWALGNAIGAALLTSTMDWAVTSAREVLTAARVATAAAATAMPTTGILAGAAPLMAWGLLVTLAGMILFSAAFLSASAVMAPIALTKTLTSGTCFVQAQVQQAISTMSAGARVAASLAGGTGAGIAAPAAGSAVASARGGGAGVNGLGGWASRTSATLTSMASRLNTAAAARGPKGTLAGLSASVLGSTAHAVQTLAGEGGDSRSADHGIAPDAPRTGFSILEMQRRDVARPTGSGSNARRVGHSAGASPRVYRRIDPSRN